MNIFSFSARLETKVLAYERLAAYKYAKKFIVLQSRRDIIHSLVSIVQSHTHHCSILVTFT